jgi:hypothetical protein
MSCSLMYNYQHFIGTCLFHLHEDRNCRLFQYVDEYLSDYMTGEVLHRHCHENLKSHCALSLLYESCLILCTKPCICHQNDTCLQEYEVASISTDSYV